jgi:hypothetical protein
MSRHHSDQRPLWASARFIRFLAIARSETRHPLEQSLFTRKPTRQGSARLVAYLRVERGHLA